MSAPQVGGMGGTPKTTTAGKTLAWFVVWGCHCSDVRIDQADLPTRCPGHDRERIAKPEQLDCLDQFVGVHDCETVANECPEGVTA